MLKIYNKIHLETYFVKNIKIIIKKINLNK